MIAAIIAAAGSGERFGAAIPKALIQLGDRTLIEHAVSAISSVADQIIVTAPSGYEKEIQTLVGDGITVVTGGATRSESVRIGLSKVSAGAEYVLIHDAARALASPDLAKRVVASLKSGDVAVIPGLAQTDTVKIVDASGIVTSTPDRAAMRRVQTPQGFTYELSIKHMPNQVKQLMMQRSLNHLVNQFA
jgi:2-C-methyl-D-erythritol 4-phosphate cytidylyltransferase / 2-C-methyl-D-erythritol 2,4-cyclodiphosphate synthase